MPYIPVVAYTEGSLWDVAESFARAATMEDEAHKAGLRIIWEAENDGIVSFRIEGELAELEEFRKGLPAYTLEIWEEDE